MKIDRLNILAIGRNPEIMTVMNRLLNAPEHWYGVTVATDEEAYAAFEKEQFRILLLCAGVTPEEETVLKDKLSSSHPDLIIRRHYGGGSGLLKNEIQFLLDQQNIQLPS